MRAEHFEDLLAWQKAHVLTLKVYKLLSNHKDFAFRNQLQRASVSIMNNIAEGFERLGDAEKRRFFSIAKGSCGEVRSMLYLARDLTVISNDDFKICYDTALEISRMLGSLIKHLEK